MSEGRILRYIGIVFEAIKVLSYAIRNRYSQFTRFRDTDSRFAFASLIILLYIIMQFTQRYQDETVENWSNISFQFGIISWFCIFVLFWGTPRALDKFELYKKRDTVKIALRSLTGIFVVWAFLLSISSYLLPTISILNQLSFAFAIASSIGLVSTTISDGSKYVRPDWTSIIRRLRYSAINGNTCTMYPVFVKPKQNIAWKTSTEILGDIFDIPQEDKHVKPLDKYPLSKASFFFKTSNVKSSRTYYVPCTESELVKSGVLSAFDSHLPEVHSTIERISLSHLLLAMIGDFNKRWDSYSASALTRGLVSIPLDTRRSYISHSWTREDIAYSASYIKSELINGNSEHPIRKWFDPINMRTINDEILLRYISILGKYDEFSREYRNDRWDAIIEGYCLVCKTAETGRSNVNNKQEETPFLIAARRVELKRRYNVAFEDFSEYENEVSKSPIEQFVKLHDEILELALSNLQTSKDMRLLEFIERAIQGMMEKIHQTKHLEGRQHRKEHLIERREGLIAGTVLGLKAVYPSILEVVKE